MSGTCDCKTRLLPLYAQLQHQCPVGPQGSRQLTDHECRAQAPAASGSLLLVGASCAGQLPQCSSEADPLRSNTAGKRPDTWTSSDCPARTDLPHVGLVDLAHWESAEPVPCLDNRLDLIATSHILIDLQTHIHGGAMRGSIGLQPGGQWIKQWQEVPQMHKHGCMQQPTPAAGAVRQASMAGLLGFSIGLHIEHSCSDQYPFRQQVCPVRLILWCTGSR